MGGMTYSYSKPVLDVKGKVYIGNDNARKFHYVVLVPWKN